LYTDLRRHVDQVTVDAELAQLLQCRLNAWEQFSGCRMLSADPRDDLLRRRRRVDLPRELPRGVLVPPLELVRRLGAAALEALGEMPVRRRSAA